MPTKKSDGGEGTRKKRSTRKKTATSQKIERVAQVKPLKSNPAAHKKPSLAESCFPATDALHTVIEKRAYELFEQRGWNHGEDLTDWLTAEREILKEHALIGS